MMKFTEVGQVTRFILYKDGSERIINPCKGTLVYGIMKEDACEFNATFPVNDKHYKKDFLIDGICDIVVESVAWASKKGVVNLFLADVIECDDIKNIRDRCNNLSINDEYKHKINGHYEFNYAITFDVEVIFIKVRFGILIKAIQFVMPVEQATDWIEKYNNYRIQRS